MKGLSPFISSGLKFRLRFSLRVKGMSHLICVWFHQNKSSPKSQVLLHDFVACLSKRQHRSIFASSQCDIAITMPHAGVSVNASLDYAKHNFSSNASFAPIRPHNFLLEMLLNLLHSLPGFLANCSQDVMTFFQQFATFT